MFASSRCAESGEGSRSAFKNTALIAYRRRDDTFTPSLSQVRWIRPALLDQVVDGEVQGACDRLKGVNRSTLIGFDLGNIGRAQTGSASQFG